MKKYNILFILLLVSLLSACSKDDETEIFQESADQRMQDALSGYMEQMTSAGEYGWKVRYFPDTTKAGGWTFLMRFNENNTVEMIGDVSADPEIVEGVYELLSSQGPVLNFGSFLPISELVNPNSRYPEARYGSNEFIFTDENFTGDIHLISKRNRSPFVLFEATEEDWETIDEHVVIEQQLAGGENPPSVYRYFTVTDGSETKTSEMFYDQFLRFMTLRSQGTSVIESSSHGVAFSNDSLYLNPPVEFKGEEINRMVYLEESDSFFGESNGVTATLAYSNTPAFTDDDYLYPGGNRYGYLTSSWNYLNDSRDLYTTDTYRALFNATDETLGQYGMYLNYVQVHFNINGNPEDNRILYNTNLGTAHVFVTVERKDNKIYMTTAGIAFTNPDEMGMLTPEDLPIHEFFTDPNGLYVDHIGSFLGFSNPGFTLVSASNPTFRVLLYGNL